MTVLREIFENYQPELMPWYSYVKEVTLRKTNVICLPKQRKATFMPKVATCMLLWSIQILYAKTHIVCTSLEKKISSAFNCIV